MIKRSASLCNTCNGLILLPPPLPPPPPPRVHDVSYLKLRWETTRPPFSVNPVLRVQGDTRRDDCTSNIFVSPPFFLLLLFFVPIRSVSLKPNLSGLRSGTPEAVGDFSALTVGFFSVQFHAGYSISTHALCLAALLWTAALSHRLHLFAWPIIASSANPPSQRTHFKPMMTKYQGHLDSWHLVSV